MIKKIIIGIAIVLVLGGILLIRSKKSRQEYRETNVSVVNMRRTINVDAVVTPDIYANITSELPIQLDAIYAKKNDKVQKGQKLFKLDRASIQAQINNARLAVEQAELAEKQSRRKWDMLKPEEKASIKKATEQARQSLNEVYAQSKKAFVTSPIDGVVIEQNARVGEVAQGIIMRIINPESLRVEALIPEVDIAKVNSGNKATIIFDAYPDKMIKGTFVSMDSGSTLKQNNTYFKAIIDIDDKSNLKILDGMNAEVDIEIARKDNVLAVSRDFAKKDKDGYFVQILNSKESNKEQFIKKYFQAGLVGYEFIEVISGLENNERVVVPESE